MFKHLPSSFALFAAALATFGTVFLVIGIHEFYRNWQFSGDVVRATGLVTGRNTTISSGRHGSSTTYHLAFRFEDSDKFTRDYNDTVTSGTYHDLREQGPVPIKYLPHMPDINRVDLPAEDHSHETKACLFTVIGGIFGGLGWFAFIALERLLFYRRWLKRRGVRCTGRVDGLTVDTSVSINKRHPSYVNYSYVDSTGRKHEDTSQDLGLKQEEQWREGDTIDVYYDPRDFSKSTVVLDR